MMDAAKSAMLPPFEIAVFADPPGSFTTAGGDGRRASSSS